MSKAVAQTVKADTFAVPRQVLIVAGATLFIALCARVTLPLPFTPVPLTLQNFAVLTVGLLLGSRRGFAALVLYLAEGAAGLPVFNSAGPGGIVQLLGPTGGYLMAYPLVALLAGWMAETGTRGFRRYLAGSIGGELVLFAFGVTWLMSVYRAPMAQALSFGLYPFVFAEVMKVAAAAGIANRWQRMRRA